MNLRYKISGTNWLCAVPDSCPFGEENWIPIFQLTDHQVNQLRIHQSFVDQIAEDVRRWVETEKSRRA